MKQIIVVAAVIERAQQILIVKRPDDTMQANLWEFPGGKVEFGETPEDALKREIEEELAMDIDNLQLLAVTSGMLTDNHTDIHAIMIAYRCTSQSKPVLRVGKALRWINKSELKNYKFALLDLPIVVNLQETREQ